MVEGRKSSSLWNFHLRHLEISGWRGFHLLRKAVAVFLFELCSNPLSINRGFLDSVCRCQLHPCIRHKAPSVFLEHLGSPCIWFSPQFFSPAREESLRSHLSCKAVCPGRLLASFFQNSDPVPSTGLSIPLYEARHTSQISSC